MKGVSNEPFAALLRERFSIESIPDDRPPLLPRERHRELARLLRDEHGYRIYAFLTAAHYPSGPPKEEGEPPEPERYEVTTALRSVGPGSRLAAWSVELPIDVALDSLVDLFAGADWQEREQYDLVGVRFAGHPDLRRIMLPEDWEGHPLRRDYPIDTPHPPWR